MSIHAPDDSDATEKAMTELKRRLTLDLPVHLINESLDEQENAKEDVITKLGAIESKLEIAEKNVSTIEARLSELSKLSLSLSLSVQIMKERESELDSRKKSLNTKDSRLLILLAEWIIWFITKIANVVGYSITKQTKKTS